MTCRINDADQIQDIFQNARSQTLEFEIAFYEKLIKENSDFIDALIPLADAYTKIGKYKKGLEIDKKLARLKNTDKTVFYNLACSYALLEMINEAFEALNKAVSLGYNDLSYLQKDPDLENIRRDDRFKKIVKQITEKY